MVYHVPFKVMLKSKKNSRNVRCFLGRTYPVINASVDFLSNVSLPPILRRILIFSEEPFHGLQYVHIKEYRSHCHGRTMLTTFTHTKKMNSKRLHRKILLLCQLFAFFLSLVPRADALKCDVSSNAVFHFFLSRTQEK